MWLWKWGWQSKGAFLCRVRVGVRTIRRMWGMCGMWGRLMFFLSPSATYASFSPSQVGKRGVRMDSSLISWTSVIKLMIHIVDSWKKIAGRKFKEWRRNDGNEGDQWQGFTRLKKGEKLIKKLFSSTILPSPSILHPSYSIFVLSTFPTDPMVLGFKWIFLAEDLHRKCFME